MSGTVIDAFLVTLGLDTKEFHTGVERSKDDQNELRRNTEENANKMKESYQGLIEKVGQLFALLAGGHEMKEFFNQTQESEVVTLRLSEMIGMSVEKLGQWQGALVVNGGSAQGFNESMKTMGGYLVAIEKNLPRAQRALKAFHEAGVKGLELGKKADILDVMDQLQVRMKGMALMEGRELGRRMGLDENFARMLHDSDNSLQDLLKTVQDIGVPTTEEAEAMERLERAQKTLSLTQGALGRIIVELLAPAVKFVTDKMLELAKWAKDHPALIRAAFIGIAAAVSVLGVAAGLAMIPMLGITATLSGIALAVGMVASGLYMLWQQNDSWLHDLVDWIQDVGKMFEDVWGRIGMVTMICLKAIWENVMNIVTVVADVLGLVLALFSLNGEKISQAWNKLCGDVNQMFKLMWNTIVFEAMFAFYSIEAGAKKLWDNMKEPAEKFFNWIASKFSWVGTLVGLVGAVKNAIIPSGTSSPENQVPVQRAGFKAREQYPLDFSTTSFGPAQPGSPVHTAAQKVMAATQVPSHELRLASQTSPATAISHPTSPVTAMEPAKQEAANHLAAIGGLPPEVPAATKATPAGQTKVMDPTSKEAMEFNRQFSFMGATPHAAMVAPAPAPVSGGTIDNSRKEVSVGQVNVYTPGTDAKSIAAELPGAIRSTGLADQSDGGI